MAGIFSGRAWGKKYQDIKKPCQDYALHWVSPQQTQYLLVVCDGAGSAKFSEKASEAMAKGLRDFFKANADSDEFQNITELDLQTKVIQCLKDKFKEIVVKLRGEGKKFTPNDLNTTLLFVYVDGPNMNYYSGHIGDGYIVRFEKKQVIYQSDPDNGEFSNETYFVTQALKDTARLRIKKGKLTSNVVGFACMSDGLDCLFNENPFVKEYYKQNYGKSQPVHPDLLSLFCNDVLLNSEDSKAVDNVLAQQFTEKKKKNGIDVRTDDDVSLALIQLHSDFTISAEGEAAKWTAAEKWRRGREEEDEKRQLDKIKSKIERLKREMLKTCRSYKLVEKRCGVQRICSRDQSIE